MGALAESGFRSLLTKTSENRLVQWRRYALSLTRNDADADDVVQEAIANTMRLAPDLEQLFFQSSDQPVQGDARLFEGPRLADLGQHEEQDDRSETAADAVQEREAEPLGATTSAPPHGQSPAGLR